MRKLVLIPLKEREMKKVESTKLENEKKKSRIMRTFHIVSVILYLCFSCLACKCLEK